jgi:glycogen debranching enzyme
MAIEARNRPLPDWFTRIRTHQTVLPRSQRFEAWSHASVTQLFNTILRDLPVGDEVKARLSSRLIPFEELMAGDYRAFVEKRAAMIHAAMTTSCTAGGS